MSTFDELDRTLGAWFEADAAAPAPMGLLDQVTAVTSARRPHPGWRASRWGHQLGDRGRATRVPTVSRVPRPALAVVTALLLALLVGAAILVGSGLLTPSPRILADSGSFTPTGPMISSRGHPHLGPTFTATLLPDGRVLVVGGIARAEATNAAAEVWDPATGMFTATGSLAVARGDHTATLLPDGRVLVAGGYGTVDGGSQSVASTEIWDPVRGSFEPAVSLTVRRKQHTATLLLDGRVLIAGGTDDMYGILPAAEILDPDTGESIALGPPVDGLKGRSATRLGDGRVLLVGGWVGDVPVASAELFDPVLGTFSPTGSLTEPRFGHTAMLLPDGRVLVVGGQDADQLTIAFAEVWDPSTGVFSPAGSVPGLRYGTAITMLRDGTILLVGGATSDPTTDLPFGVFGGPAYIWDPVTGDASPAGSPTQGRISPAATLLTDGRVLIVSGLGPEPPPTDCRPAGPRTRIRTCTSVEPSLDSAELWSPRDWSP